MRPPRSPSVLIPLLATLLGSARPSLAQAPAGGSARAQSLLDEGVNLMDAGKVAQGCAKMEESQRLEAGMKTQFRLAQCYEKLGKLGAALGLYRDVVVIAHKANRPDREDFARKSAEAIDARVPRFSIAVPEEVAAIPGLSVVRNGDPVGRSQWGTMIPVDPGEHTVTVTAPGKKGWTSKRSVREGAKVEVRVPLLGGSTEAGRAPVNERTPAVSAAPDEAASKRRKVIVVTGIAAGAVALGVGTGFAIVSQQKAGQSHDLEKPGASCTPDCKTQFDGLQQDRAMFANVATWSFLTAGAIGGGTLLYGLLSAPPAPPKTGAQIRVVPQGAGAALVGIW